MRFRSFDTLKPSGSAFIVELCARRVLAAISMRSTTNSVGKVAVAEADVVDYDELLKVRASADCVHIAMSVVIFYAQVRLLYCNFTA